MSCFCSFKPGVSRQAHFLLAATIWTGVGLSLMLRGWVWMQSAQALPLIGLSLILGTLKSFFLLDKTALRTMERIVFFERKTCLGAVYSWRMWLFALGMMGAGFVVRSLWRPGPLLATIYFAVGWALCLSSRHGWRQVLLHSGS